MSYKFSILSLLLIIPLALKAQSQADVKPFQHVDIAVTGGSTGVGIDVSTSLNSWLSVRAGASYVPRINFPHQFVYSMKDGTSKENSKTKFNKMADLMESLTGYRPTNIIDFERYPTFDNVKLLFDIYPLKNKHWHATAGFYYGSRNFVYESNTLGSSPALSSISLYNNIYFKAINNEPLISDNGTAFPEDVRQKFVQYGYIAINLGVFTHDIYDENGNLLHKEGDKFQYTPDMDGSCIAEARVNKFRPYLGIGYSGRLAKKNDHWHVGFEAGAMFWGGKPKDMTTLVEHIPVLDPSTGKTVTEVHTYGIDLSRDVKDMIKSVQDQVNISNALPVFPVLELRLAYRLK